MNVLLYQEVLQQRKNKEKVQWKIILLVALLNKKGLGNCSTKPLQLKEKKMGTEFFFRFPFRFQVDFTSIYANKEPF